MFAIDVFYTFCNDAERSHQWMKKEIAIFVSHRIDLPCETPKSPIYHPTRCGAVFDESLSPQIPGDDTGDNISHLRN